MRNGVKHTIKKNSTYFMTLTVVEWVDAFSQTNHKEIVINSLRYCIKNKGLNVYAYCLMPNHLHIIANCNEPFQLSNAIRDFKRHVAKTIYQQIQNETESQKTRMTNIFVSEGRKSKSNEEYKFWKAGNHAIEVYGEVYMDQG